MNRFEVFLICTTLGNYWLWLLAFPGLGYVWAMQTIFLTSSRLPWLIGALCGRKKETKTPKCEVLGRRKAFSFSASGDLRINCLKGMIWITGVENRGDVILRPGGNVAGGRQRIVIEALEDSVIEFTPT